MRYEKLFALAAFITLPYGVNAQTEVQGAKLEIIAKAKSAGKNAFVVDFLGNIYQRPPQPIDESEELLVLVVAPAELFHTLKVYRSSPGRDPSVIYSIGEKALEKLTISSNSSNFVYRAFSLSDFAPGEGVITMEATIPEATFTSNFKFVVNKLFAGAFHFGPIYTRLEDNTYGLTNTAQGNVVYVSDRKSPRVDYMIAYSPFLFGGKRDIQKANKWFAEPFIGSGLTKIGENGFAGLSLGRPELFYFVIGVHVGKVNILRSSDEVGVGRIFNGSAETIPTESKIDTAVFYGVTLDLRTAKNLFTSVFTANDSSR